MVESGFFMSHASSRLAKLLSDHTHICKSSATPFEPGRARRDNQYDNEDNGW